MDAPPWGVLTAAAGATKNFASRSLAVFDGRTPARNFRQPSLFRRNLCAGVTFFWRELRLQ